MLSGSPLYAVDEADWGLVDPNATETVAVPAPVEAVLPVVVGSGVVDRPGEVPGAGFDPEGAPRASDRPSYAADAADWDDWNGPAPEQSGAGAVFFRLSDVRGVSAKSEVLSYDLLGAGSLRLTADVAGLSSIDRLKASIPTSHGLAFTLTDSASGKTLDLGGVRFDAATFKGADPLVAVTWARESIAIYVDGDLVTQTDAHRELYDLSKRDALVRGVPKGEAVSKTGRPLLDTVTQIEGRLTPGQVRAVSAELTKQRKGETAPLPATKELSLNAASLLSLARGTSADPSALGLGDADGVGVTAFAATASTSNVLWGIDEDDGGLFAIWDVSDPIGSLVHFGTIAYDAGTSGDLSFANTSTSGSRIESMAISLDGQTAYFAVNANLTFDGSVQTDGPYLFKLDLTALQQDTQPVAQVVGHIDVTIDDTTNSFGDMITGLAFDPNAGTPQTGTEGVLYATFRDTKGPDRPDLLLNFDLPDTGHAHSTLLTLNSYSELRPHTAGEALIKANSTGWDLSNAGGIWALQADSSASDGQSFTVLPPNDSFGSAPSTGIISHNFQVGQNGTYNLHARVIAPTSSDDSVWIRIENVNDPANIPVDWTGWNNIESSTDWVWDRFHNLHNNSQFVDFALDSTETYRLSIAYREDGIKLDRVLITTDTDPLGSPLGGAEDLAFAPDGTLYVSDVEDNKIYEVDKDTGAVLGEVTTTALSNPEAFAIDPDSTAGSPTIITRQYYGNGSAPDTSTLADAATGNTLADANRLSLDDIESLAYQVTTDPRPIRETIWLADEAPVGNASTLTAVWNLHDPEASQAYLGELRYFNTTTQAFEALQAVEAIAIDPDTLTAYIVHNELVSDPSITQRNKIFTLDLRTLSSGGTLDAQLLGTIDPPAGATLDEKISGLVFENGKLYTALRARGTPAGGNFYNQLLEIEIPPTPGSGPAGHLVITELGFTDSDDGPPPTLTIDSIHALAPTAAGFFAFDIDEDRSYTLDRATGEITAGPINPLTPAADSDFPDNDTQVLAADTNPADDQVYGLAQNQTTDQQGILQYDPNANTAQILDGFDTVLNGASGGGGLFDVEGLATLSDSPAAPTPAITVTPDTTTLDEGQSVTLTLAVSNTTATGWTIDWGDGTLEVITGSPTSAIHTYADGNNIHTITATAHTADGDLIADPTTIQVDNVAPTLTLSGPATVEAGSTYTLNLASSDPGDDTITQWTIDWGDGTSQTITDGSASVTKSDYTPDTYTITATATDEDGTFNANSIAVIVTAPQATTVTLHETTHLVRLHTDETAGDPVIFDIPASPGALRIDFSALGFADGDTPGQDINPNDINDAFELALINTATGESVVSTIGVGRDAFFNLTQGQNPLRANGVALVDNTGSVITSPEPASGTVYLDLSTITPGTPPGTTVELIARLLNNDADDGSTVTLDFNLDGNNDPVFSSFDFSGTTPNVIPAATSATATATANTLRAGIDYAALSDVTTAFDIDYAATSYETATQTLSSGLSLTKAGSRQVRGDLLLTVRRVVTQDADPVADSPAQLADYDALLPLAVDGVAAGTPFIKLTDLLEAQSTTPSGNGDGFYLTNASIDDLLLQFTGVQADERFDYEVVLLGETNTAPTFTSTPYTDQPQGQAYRIDRLDPVTDSFVSGLEIVAQNNNALRYALNANDPDGDTYSFSLLTGPDGMSIDADNTLVWTPAASDTGTHSIRLRVTDQHGLFDAAHDQLFTVTVEDTITNRAPYFTTDPATVAYAGQPYTYDADAFDPDGDTLTYSGTVSLVPETETGLFAKYTPTGGDASLNGHDATLVGPPAAVTDPTLPSTPHTSGGQALELDGTNDWIDLAAWSDSQSDTVYENLNAAFTQRSVALWFNTADTSTTQTLYEEGGFAQGFALRIHNGEIEFAVRDQSVQYTLSTADHLTASISANSWHHVTAVFDAGQMALHLDGQRIAVLHTPFTTVGDHGDFAGLASTAGGGDAFGDTADNRFNGKLADPRIYETALGREQAAHLAGQPTDSITPNTFAHYALNDTTTGATDTSGNNNDAILAGGPTPVTDPDAPAGQALAFDGIDDWVDLYALSDNSTQNLTTGLNAGFSEKTVALWVSPTKSFTQQTLYDEGGSQQGFGLRIINGKLQFAIRQAAEQHTVETDITADTWSHVAASFDHGRMTLFLNGRAVAIEDTSLDEISDHGDSAGIGKTASNNDAFGTTTASFFQGRLADAHILNTALSEHAIADLITRDRVQIDPNTGNVNWIPLSDRTGQTLRVHLTATDPQGLTGTQPYDIAVQASNTPLSLSLPDLTIDNLDVSGLTWDTQNLTVEGVITAEIANLGTTATQQPFRILFFEDTDFSQTYTHNIDNVIGSTVFNSTLKDNTTSQIISEVQGNTAFSGNRLWALVDSSDVISESDESNNTNNNRHDCKVISHTSGFAPSIEWQRTAGNRPFTILPQYHYVYSTPAVVDINEDKVPDIIVPSGDYNDYGYGPLRALDGRTGEEIWDIAPNDYADSIYDPDQYVSTDNGVAVGDIDNDNKIEIVAISRQVISGLNYNQVRVFDHNGYAESYWNTPLLFKMSQWSYPSIADLDSDGNTEIITGAYVLDNEGNIIGEIPSGDYASSIPIVADINQDGVSEIIHGSNVYDMNGNPLAAWNNSYNLGGDSAIADLDGDGDPEIIVSNPYGDWRVYYFNSDGSEFQPSTYLETSGGGLDTSGGAPTIGDFDGDLIPEIGVAGATNYYVIDNDGAIKWTLDTDDLSSGVTGSTLFDFDGDKKPEIVYRDESSLYILSVPENAQSTELEIRYQTPMASATGREMPIVADVDADGNAEIIATQDKGSGRGLYVYGDINDTWVPTRQVWNQHSYHITNINDDGTIPTNEAPSWQSNNTYRLNTILDPDFDPRQAPDLIPSYVRIAEVAGETTYTARIGNAGSFFAPDSVNVAFFDGNPFPTAAEIAAGQTPGTQVGVVQTATRLDVGQWEDVSLTLSGPAITDLWVVADWDQDALNNNPPMPAHGYVLECREENNVYSLLEGLIPRPSNTRPGIDSAPVVTAVADQAYSYQVLASDTDNHALSYSLRQGGEGMSIDSSTGLITWEPGLDALGTHQVIVQVSDGYGGTAYQPFTLQVISSNEAPTLTLPPYGVAAAGELWTLEARADDPNGDPLSYRLTAGPRLGEAGLEPLVDANGVVTWTPQAADQGRAHYFELEVDDRRGGVTRQGFWVGVESNAAPRITSSPDAAVFLNEQWSYTVVAEDAEDGTNLTYSLDDRGIELGASINATTGELTWTPQAAGTDAMTVTVTDSGGATAQQVLTLPVNVKATQPEPPAIESEPKGPALAGRPWTYAVQAKDPNGDALSYTLVDETGQLVSTLNGVAIDTTTGVVSWASPVVGSRTFTVRAYETATSASYADQIVTLPVLANSAPVITQAVARASGQIGSTLDLSLEVFDWDGDALSFGVVPGSITGGGAWAFTPPVLSAASGDPENPDAVTLRFTPESEGAQSLTIEVRDSVGNSTLHTVHLQVYGVAQSTPGLSVRARTAIGVGQTFLAQATAEDPDGDVPSYALVPDGSHPLPAGMTIDTATGQIQWTPGSADVGSYTYKVQATAGVDTVTSDALALEVISRAQGNQPPTIGSNPTGLSGTWNRPMVYEVWATDPENDPLTWTLASGPSSASIDPVTGRFVWQPTRDELGQDQEAVIAVADPYGGRSEQTITLTSTPQSRTQTPPVIDAADGLLAGDGRVFTFGVPARDPDGDRLSFELVGPVPGDMTIDSSGRVTWTASGTNESFTVRATDPSGMYAQRTFSVDVISGSVPTVELRVSDATPNPGQQVVFAVSADDELGITDTTLQLIEDWVGGRTLNLDLDAQGLASYEVPAGHENDTVTLTATATNTEGTTVTTVRTLVIETVDVLAPFVELVGPYNGLAIEETVAVRGRAYDQDGTGDLAALTVSIRNLESNAVTEIYNGTNVQFSGPGQGATQLGTAQINPWVLANGDYELSVTATDPAGNTVSAFSFITIQTENAVKIGNFALSFTDLSTAVSGIPISVTRSYDTLDADSDLDFGYGWSLEVATGSVSVSNLGPDDITSSGDPNFNTPWRFGTRLTFEMPGGQELGFTAIPQSYTIGGSAADRFAGALLSSGENAAYAIAFVPDDLEGQGAILEFVGGQRIRLDDAVADQIGVRRGTYIRSQTVRENPTGGLMTDDRLPFNPITTNYDYRLTLEDSSQYIFDSRTGELTSVTDTNGNTLRTGGDTIVSTNADGEETGRVKIFRDNGRITRIEDSEGDAITYGYDALGNLQWVRDRSGRVTTMGYSQEEFSDIDPLNPYELGDHILTSITQYPDATVPSDPTALLASGGGFDAMRIGFNADGTLQGITDASGASAGFGYTFDGPDGTIVETVTDATPGNAISTEIMRDARGKTLRTVQQLSGTIAAGATYLVSVYEYDREDNQTAAYQPFEVTEPAGGDNTRFTKDPTTVSGLPAPTQTTYDDFGRPTTVTDALSHTTTYSYDDRGNPTSIEDALGNISLNRYDGQNRLTQTTDAEGNITRYGYDNNSNLNALIQVDDTGREVIQSTFNYDARGRLASTTDTSGGGVTRYFAYDNGSSNGVGNQTHSWSFKDNLTTASVTVYDDEGRVTDTAQYSLTGEITSFNTLNTAITAATPDWSTSTTYDALGRAITSTDRFGTVTETTYDARGNVVETRTQTSTSNAAPGVKDAWIVSRTAYDDNGRAVASTDPFLISVATGNFLDPTDESDTGSAPGGRSFLHTTQTVYDAAGRVIATLRIEGLSALIDLVADPNNPGQEKTIYTEVQASDPAVQSASETVYDALGRVHYTIAETPSGNLVTESVYDALGRQERTISNPQTFQDGTTTNSNYISTLPTSVTTTTYDALGRQETVRDPADRVTRFIYDDLGRVTQTIQEGRHTDDGNGNYTDEDPSNNLTTRTVYDARGRRVAEIDPLGRRTDYAYDNAGRLETVTLPGVDDALTPQTDLVRPTYTYTYAYDAYGNQTSITDPKGNVTEFDYDELNRQVGRQLPIGVAADDASFTESMSYFSSGIHFGLLETATDFEGNTVTYTYDAYGRQKTATYRDDSNAVQRTVTTTYDALGRAISMADTGNQGNGTTTYTFDDEGRLITRVTPQGTLNHEYDVLGRMVATYTNSTRTEYEHDALGRITDVKLKKRFGTDLSGNGEHTEYVYDEAGQLDYEVGANGVTKDHLYDALGRLEQIVHFNDTNDDGTRQAGETLVAQFSYTYDNAGNRLSSTEQIGFLEQVFTYEYDGLNRLVREQLASSTDPSRDYTTTYTFDLSSNRTAVTKDDGSDGSVEESTTYTYNANDQLITESLDANNNGSLTDTEDRITTYGYTFTTQTSKTVNDGTGTNVETRTQTYDVMGRLASVTIDKAGSGITTETYTYDTSGLRVSKTVDAPGSSPVTTLYLFDPSNPTGYAQVLEEGIDADGDGELDAAEVAAADTGKTYTLGHDVLTQAVAGVTAQVLTLLYDIHGSTRALTDDTGSIVDDAAAGLQVFTYDAYGNAIGFDEALALTTLLYSGEWTNANTGVQNLRDRVYIPQIGRFNRLDTFSGNSRNPVSFHKYLYGHANPISNIDPSGQASIGEFVTQLGIRAGELGRRIAIRLRQARGVAVAAYRVVVNSVVIMNLAATIAEAASDISAATAVARATPYQFKRLALFNRTPKNQLTRRAVRRIIRVSQFGVRAGRATLRANARGMGVTIKPNGLPNFSSHLYQGVGKNRVFIKLTGSRFQDERRANQKARLTSTPFGYTWHHHEVMGIMELVKASVHRSHGHSGGALFWDITGNTFRY